MKYAAVFFLLAFSGPALAQKVAPAVNITQRDCNAQKLGTTIPASAIGEPVASVTLNAPVWVPANADVRASWVPGEKPLFWTGSSKALSSSWPHLGH